MPEPKSMTDLVQRNVVKPVETSEGIDIERNRCFFQVGAMPPCGGHRERGTRAGNGRSINIPELQWKAEEQYPVPPKLMKIVQIHDLGNAASEVHIMTR